MTNDRHIPVIDLSKASGAREAWDRPIAVLVLWMLVEFAVVTNPLQVSSTLRAIALRAFGARIGRRVVLRPRIRVKFPWKLEVGDHSWIGEGVWIHNQAHVSIGRNVVLSQETFVTTGSHRQRRDMALVTRPIAIEDGAWITSRCVVLGGAQVGRSALARPMTVVKGTIAPNSVVSGTDCTIVGTRFPHHDAR